MRQRLIASLVAVMAIAGLSGPSFAAEADATIRRFNDKLLEVMKNGPKLGFKGRLEKMRGPVAEAYDIPTITKAMLGPSSVAKLTPEELAALAVSYSEFSSATYASQFDDWEGERLEVGETRPSTAGAVIVQSWIVPKTGEPTQIDYVMRQDQGQWKIADVLYDGSVSQVAVRRSEFGSIFRAKGFAGLKETIDKQTSAMEKK